MPAPEFLAPLLPFAQTSNRLRRRLPVACTAVLLAAPLLVPSALLAQESDVAGFAMPPSEDGARQLEAALTDAFGRLLSDMANEDIDAELRFDGEPVATPDGDAYALAIPKTILEFGGDFVGELPPFDADVRPLDDGWLDIAWTLQSPATAFDPRGDGRATLSFEPTDSRVVYAPQYGVLMDGDVSLEALELGIESDGEAVDATLASVAVLASTQADPAMDDLYDSQGSIVIQDLLVTGMEDAVRVALEGIDFEAATTAQRFDLFALLNEQTRDIDPDDTEAMLEAFAAVLADHAADKWLGSFAMRFGMSGLDIDTPDLVAAVDGVEFELSAGGLDGDASSIGIAAAAAGIASPQIPPPFVEVAPTAFSVALAGENLPFEALLDRVYAQVDLGEAEMGPKGRRMGTGFDLEALEDLNPMEMLGIVLQSDAVLVLEGLNIDAPIGHIDATGTVEPAPASPFQAVADIDIAIAGLPEIIAFAQSMGGDAAEVAAVASLFSAMGQDETDEDGTPVKAFNLVVTEAGQVLLNGNDMSAMMGMFQ
ncbi:MAG: hypothetical protein AAF739_16415 [Pseudomonadota bacterium]